MLNKHFGSCRFIYNWALDMRKKAYENEKSTIKRTELQEALLPLKKEKEWLKEINSQSLQATLFHLDNAYKKFFREKSGFPRFKSKHNRQSFECPQNVKVDFEQSKISFPKIGWVKLEQSRIFEGTVKTVTVSKTPTEKYYVSVLVENGQALPKIRIPDFEQSVGIDVGIKSFAVLSNSKGIEDINNPKYLKKSLEQLKRLQKQVSRKVKGSNNRKKAIKKLAMVHEKVSSQRSDFLHKLSTRIVSENQTICVEDLHVKGMIQNHKLAQSISDVGWGIFFSMLEYKATWQGKPFLEADRFAPSSKKCSCGVINNNLTLKDRVWLCASCGNVNQRDPLAAENIRFFAFEKYQSNNNREGHSRINACGKVGLPTSLKQEPHTL